MNKLNTLTAFLLAAAFTLSACAGTQRTFKKDSPCGQIEINTIEMAQNTCIDESKL